MSHLNRQLFDFGNIDFGSVISLGFWESTDTNQAPHRGLVLLQKLPWHQGCSSPRIPKQLRGIDGDEAEGDILNFSKKCAVFTQRRGTEREI